MFLVAHDVRVDVTGGGQDLLDVYVRLVDLVVVVRNVDLFFTDDGPVVAIRGAVEQAIFIIHPEAARTARRVVADGRRAAHAALPWGVLPGLPRFGGGVDELVTDHDLTLLAHGLQGGEQKVREDATGCVQGLFGVGPHRKNLVVDLLRHPIFVGIDHCLLVDSLFGRAPS
ncbi:hypothetical protein D3C80_1175200 [compost metagenome]